ncbi:MAG: AAA family ATPase [Oscillospiraceae bacterium]|nr:AAA family ATPase [Oscillospiraceae bacterium]
MNMELLYVWIGENESGFIQNQGFHFSPEYRFTMEFNKTEGIYYLDCIHKEDSLNIWNTGNLCGLTAVVGENGTGKTTLIKSLLMPNNNDAKLMVYKFGDEFYIWNFLKRKVRYWIDTIKENDPNGIRQIPICMTNAQGGRFDNLLSNVAVFSPDTDIRYHFSVDSWSCAHTRPIPELVTLYRDHTDIEFDKLAVMNYYHHQFIKSIEKTDDTESNKQESLLKVNSTLTIGLSRSFSKIIDMVCKIYWDAPTERLETHLKKYRKRFRNSHSLTDRLWLLLLADLYYLVDTTYMCNRWEQLSVEPREFTLVLLQATKNERVLNQRLVSHYTQAVDEIDELQKIFKELDSTTSVPPAEDSEENTIILAFDENPEVYMSFCKYISDLLRKKYSFVLSNLSIGMSELSSGERAMQNICAWMTIASNSAIREKLSQDKNILLLLDEVDLYMHPEWQRRFLDFMARELELQFPDYRIQVVITTHSPLILSDVPSGNIIYLGRKSSRCRIENGPEKTETFGANIFTLLKDSFYLERSLGEFAYNRIRKVIDDLQALKNWGNADDLKQRKLEESITYEQHRMNCKKHKQLIDIIGEPVVKGKLQRLYTELFSEDKDTCFEKQLTDIKSILQTMAPAKRQRHIEQLSRMLSVMKEHMD